MVYNHLELNSLTFLHPCNNADTADGGTEYEGSPERADELILPNVPVDWASLRTYFLYNASMETKSRRQGTSELQLGHVRGKAKAKINSFQNLVLVPQQLRLCPSAAGRNSNPCQTSPRSLTWEQPQLPELRITLVWTGSTHFL